MQTSAPLRLVLSGASREVRGLASGADGLRFGATFPTTGRYRLFVQFQHEGEVQTVAVTQEVQ